MNKQGARRWSALEAGRNWGSLGAVVMGDGEGVERL